MITYIIMGSVGMICLDKTLINKNYKVLEVNSPLTIKRRFLDIGIVPGTSIKKVLISPFGGMSAYFIMGSTIAIRDGDAEGIMVVDE